MSSDLHPLLLVVGLSTLTAVNRPDIADKLDVTSIPPGAVCWPHAYLARGSPLPPLSHPLQAGPHATDRHPGVLGDALVRPALPAHLGDQPIPLRSRELDAVQVITAATGHGVSLGDHG